MARFGATARSCRCPCQSPRCWRRRGGDRCPRRAPVAESRLRYDADRAGVELVADRTDGPYAGVHRMTALEFLARWVDRVPECYEVTDGAQDGTTCPVFRGAQLLAMRWSACEGPRSYRWSKGPRA